MIGLEEIKPPKEAPNGIHVVLLVCVIFSVLSISYALVRAWIPDFERWWVVLQVITDLVLFLGLSCLFVLIFKLDAQETFQLRVLRPAQLVVVLLVALASVYLIYGIVVWADDFFRSRGYKLPYPAKDVETLMNRTMSYGEWVKVGVFVFLPGLCEEFLFRGFVLSGLKRSFGGGIGLLMTSLLFGMAHGFSLWMVSTFFLGLIFGSVTLLCRTVWAGVVAHMVNNLCAVYIFQKVFEGVDPAVMMNWPIMGAAALLLVSGMALLYIDFRAKNRV